MPAAAVRVRQVPAVPVAEPAAGHVVLVGMMGTGKSSVGQRVAEALGRPFLDTDALVEAHAGRTVTEIFAAEQEAGFRGREASAVEEAAGWAEPAVVATGGGAVLHPVNRARLSACGTVVWLTASAATLAERLGDCGKRPLLADGRRAEVVLQDLLDERGPLYADVADVTVGVDDLTREQVAECVLAAVASATPMPGATR
jgi:shikimate kinase